MRRLMFVTILVALCGRAAWAGPPPPPIVPAQGMPAGTVEPNQGSNFAGLGIEAQDDGSWLYVDPTGHFTARFLTDGSVQFADRWRRPDSRDSQNGRCCAPPPPAPSIRSGRAIGGPTEWMYRWLGEDVSARKKAELLQATLDIRLEMAIEHTKALIADALAQLNDDLDAIRCDDSSSPADKRRRVFEIWDDCDERMELVGDGVPNEVRSEIDEVRLDAAWMARRQVEAWIRVHMPRSRGYGDRELEALDAQRLSHEPFDPYTKRSTTRASP